MFTDGKIGCQTINYVQRVSLLSVKTKLKNHISNTFYGWNECSKNDDISVLTNFLAIFSNFFDIEKFYQILSTCQISDQLDHSNRNYRGGRPRRQNILNIPNYSDS